MLVLITGASVGFGRACAIEFAARGDSVIALARRESHLISLQQEIATVTNTAIGQRCEIIACDVCDIDTIKSKLDEILTRRKDDSGFSKGISVLVNNAGLALGLSPADESDIKDWERMIEVNILSLVRLTRLILPQMVAKRAGHIINIGSIAGSYAYPGSTVYGASKAFVKQFSLNLRADLSSKNIRITDIEPGLAGGSEFSLVRFKGDEKRASSVYEGTEPLNPKDIAEAVCWVAHLPSRVNINRLEMMPTCQAPAALAVHKSK